MKFKADGMIFSNINEAKKYYCNQTCGCKNCCFALIKHCDIYCKENPRKSAEMMGFKIIEDESENKQGYVPLDISSMTLAQVKDYCNRHRNDNCGEDCEFRRRYVCGYGCAIDIYRWNLESPRLTPDELTICMALGAKWISRNNNNLNNYVDFWDDKPQIDDEGSYNVIGAKIHAVAVRADKLPSVKPGDCLCVDDVGG